MLVVVVVASFFQVLAMGCFLGVLLMEKAPLWKAVLGCLPGLLWFPVHLAIEWVPLVRIRAMRVYWVRLVVALVRERIWGRRPSQRTRLSVVTSHPKWRYMTFSCDRCLKREVCEFAFDPYNFDNEDGSLSHDCLNAK